MRAATAYFAGAGTVLVAIGVGVGGGLTVARIIGPQTHAVTGFERRADALSIAASAAQAPVPYVAATQALPAAVAAAGPAQSRSLAAGTVGRPAPPETASSSTAKREATLDDANAKARDADLKRLAEKKAERRRHWVDRRHSRDQQSGDEEQPAWNGSDQGDRGYRGGYRDRGDYIDRGYRDRDYVERPGELDRPGRMEFPHFSLFGRD